MTTLCQLGLILFLCNNFALLFVARLHLLIRLVAFQGFLLTALLLLMPRAADDITHIVLLAGAVLLIKALGLPWLLRRTLRRVLADTPTIIAFTPRLNHSLSVVAGLAALIFSLWLETRLPLAQEIFPPLFFPVALTTLFTGLLLVAGRTMALTQVIGYLVAENGIFLLGMPLMAMATVWFELALLLDIFVAIFVMGIAINHINKSFDSIEVGRFCTLRD